MRKHKLFLPIFIAFLALLLGTNLAFSIVGNGRDSGIKEDLADNPSLHEKSMAGDAEQKQQMLEEDLADPKDEELPTDWKDESDEAEEAGEPKEADEAIEEAVEAKDPAPQPVQMAVIAVDGLNVRPDPSPNNERIDVLLRGQTVEVIAEQDNWLQVKLSDGRIGWISGAYVHRFSPTANGNALAGRVIVIDPGHGGADPGAVGVTGLLEKEINLDVSLRVAAKLRAEGAEVIMTRDTDIFISLAQRVTIAEAARADVFVSVHANAHPNPLIGGTETYYFGKKATSNASINLAALIQHELARALGLRDIGVKEASFLVIRQTTMPSVLMELAFLSNGHEESLMRTDKFRQNSADAIVRALLNYFN